MPTTEGAAGATHHPGVWQTHAAPSYGLPHDAARGLSSRHPQLDAQLPGGGWPVGMLTELITKDPGIGELRLLVPLLRQLTVQRKVVILLSPPMVPYAPALAAFGIDPDCVIVIQAVHPADRLWAVEQTLKSSSFGALLAWLPSTRTRPEHLRRLQLAAHDARGPVFLFRPLPARFESSPAPLRLLLTPQPAQRLSVEILKRRGPLLAAPMLLDLPLPPSVLPLTVPAHPATAPGMPASAVTAPGAPATIRPAPPGATAAGCAGSRSDAQAVPVRPPPSRRTPQRPSPATARTLAQAHGTW